MTLRELITLIRDVIVAVWEGLLSGIGRGIDTILNTELKTIFCIIGGFIVFVIIIRLFDMLTRRFPKLEKLRIWYVMLIMIIAALLAMYVAAVIPSLCALSSWG